MLQYYANSPTSKDSVNNGVFRGLKATEPLPSYVSEKGEYQLKKKDLY